MLHFIEALYFNILFGVVYNFFSKLSEKIMESTVVSCSKNDNNSCSVSDDNNNIQHNVHMNDERIRSVEKPEIAEDYSNLLPDEILEFIISYLPPYKDLETCCLVSKRWRNITKSR